MAYALTDVLADRHRRLRQELGRRGLDALVVTHLPNVLYLTNFAGTAAIVLMSADALHFITDFRYVAAVETSWSSPSACPGATLVRVDDTYDGTLLRLIGSMGLARVGFEPAHVPVAQHARWLSGLQNERAPGAGRVDLIPMDRAVEALRVRKDAHEIATLRRAASILDAAFDRVAAEVRPGRSERQVAAGIDWVLKDGGFDKAAFDTIVASGPNGALPHARPGDRTLASGDLVVLDFGGVYDGYCVDLTRTVSLGAPDEEARRVYAAVSEAHAAGVAASKMGATAGDIDRAARGTLEKLGLGEAFGHGTGHGLGIEVHEEPWLRKTAPGYTSDASRRKAGAEEAVRGGSHEDVVIEEGMVFTIEPGAYLPGWGGARLEDDVLVTADGPELLTHVPREMLVL